MTNNEKLINTLKEVFMLDKAELDFGIYRIMNQKRKDIEHFLEKDLVPQVKTVLADSLSIDKQALQKELEEAVKSASALGADPESLPKVQQLKARLGEAGSLDTIENEVFSLLANFFKRYFDNGDFISMRRYKKDVYAIPYEGEEVKLYWANADQYYIKTSEYFKNYRFKLSSGKAVSFELVEASTEQNNNKTQGDKERKFAIYAEQPFDVVDGEFKIYFTYDPVDKKVKQQDLLDKAFETVKDHIPTEFSELLALRPTEKDKQRTLLQKHLLDYTARNTFDYFIHKDLGGFLSRELDFYIKNEVLFIDDLNTRDEQEFLKQLSKIKAVKKIGEKIITFLAQLENFQKKLWLKKKVVVECNYCITLDRVPGEFYEEIANNKAQMNEWVRLFAIDEIKPGKSGDIFAEKKVAFTNPLSVDFLKENQFLTLDTAFYPLDFKWKLLSSIDNIDEQCDGLLINSENFQALNLLQERYKKEVKCIYIDPPYNTSEETFVYKNLFKHSSWLTMMNNKLSLSDILTDDGVLINAIDDEELYENKLVLDVNFGAENYVGTLVMQTNPRGRGISGYFATSHDYLLFYGKDKSKVVIENQPLTAEQKEDFNLVDSISEYRLLPFRRSGGLSTPSDRPNSEFDLIYDPNVKNIVAVGGKRKYPFPKEYEPTEYWVLCQGELQSVSVEYIETQIASNKLVQILPIDTDGKRRVWRWSDRDKILEAAQAGDFLVQEGRGKYTIQLKDRIKDGRKPKTIWYDSKYDASSYGTILIENILGDSRLFGYPKSIHNVIDSLFVVIGKSLEATTIDYFAGSGTTGHAVINMNREDGGKRKYILVEMGTYFESVTKPRVQKVAYSKEWKNGKPVSRDGISHCFKYLRLESYEDTLNNLVLKRTENQELALNGNANFKEGYMLNYLLDVEAQDSLLNLDWFVDPFNCYLNIIRNNEMQPTKVDLVETFNYLIGLVIASYAAPKEGFVVVTGRNLSGQKTLIVWRDCNKHDRAALNTFLEKGKYNPLDSEFDQIYVNGDNNVENLKTGDERWKVTLIEEEFKKRMFENI